MQVGASEYGLIYTAGENSKQNSVYGLGDNKGDNK